MTSHPILRDPYTNNPLLHSNLLVGSLQLFSWLLFHPSSWRNHLARVAHPLPADFCLAELSHTQWRNPALQRLFVQSYLVWPCLVCIIVLLVLGLLGMSGHKIMHGVAFGAAVCFATSIAGGGVIAVAGGLAAAILGGIISGVARGVMGEGQLGTALDLIGSMAACGIAGGAISISASVASWRGVSPIVRRIGSIMLGILIAVLITGIVVLVLHSETSAVMAGVEAGGVAGAITGVAIGLRAQRWRHGLTCGLAAACIAGVAHAVVSLGYSHGVTGIAAGVAAGVLCSALFTLPYALASRLADPWAGGIAGALGGGGGLAFVLSNTAWFPFFASAAPWRFLPYNLLGTLLGLTQTLWRPLLSYPFQAAWSTTLYHLDAQRADTGIHLLRWHAVFWDELQRLPLPFLDEHLILVAERNWQEGQVAIAYVATSHQRWAAQAAQIELDARRLERCREVMMIRTMHHSLTVSELEGPASTLLRNFSRVSQDVDAALHQASTYNQRLALHLMEERLDDLLQGLTRSSERYAIRFRSIAESWRHIVAVYTAQLARSMELRQEIVSPYVLGVPLTPQQEIFVGRRDIGVHLEQLLGGRRHPPLLLYGQRRMGKTSLLHHLGRLLPSTIIPLFVDLQGPASVASDHRGFLYNLARGMSTSARQQRNVTLPALDREALAVDPFTRFDEWLDEVEQILEPNTALLALDEFETLDSAIAAGRFQEEAVLGMLRHLIQHRPRFKVLLAGSHTLDELHRWASYLINVHVVHLGYLQEADARQLIEHPIPDFALRYEPEASQRVLDLTRCHPALVQLLCAEIVAYKNDQAPSERRMATLADVEAAVPRALRSGSLFFADIARNQVDTAGRTVLQLLAAQGPRRMLSHHDLVATLATLREETLQKLMQREVIEEVEDGYRFQVELIRRWFTDMYR